MNKRINWRVFFILLAMCMLSVLAVLPYVLTIQLKIISNSGLPIASIILIQLIQSAILFSLALYIGLRLKTLLGFKTPLLDAFVDNKYELSELIHDIFRPSFVWGIITAISIYLVDYLFTWQGVAISTSQDLAPIWQKLLASFYGGITEEVLLRLFLMTLLVYGGSKILRQKRPSNTVIIVAIFISAIIFGLGHLPITASITQITPMVILRAIILNGIGGVVFGWLFWKKGLESAMLAHFTTDIFLLTLIPLILKF